MDAKAARRADPSARAPAPSVEARAGDQGETARDNTTARSERGAPGDRQSQVRADGPAEKARATLRDSLRRHPYVATGAATAIALVLAATVAWWLHARNYESTDDAFIDTRAVTIASQLTGRIVWVPVTDNEEVPTGATLVGIDPRDYVSALAQAKAQVDQALAQIANLDAQIEAQNARIDAAKKQVEEAQAAATFSQEESARAQALLARGAGTQQQAQQTASDLRQKEAALLAAQANEAAAEKQIAILQTQKQSAQAQLEQANAARDQAQTNFSRTQITAPETGRATKISAAVGDVAQPGQALMIFVPARVWVTANFKETQLKSMRAGESVEISVDAYPGRTFHGHVDSIQAGSGAAFSLLPPENATGNYVKVVQRVPVKIVFDGNPSVYLGPGMSVVPTVKVR